MAKNKVQFQKGYSLFEFMQDYGSEEQCEQALFAWRYPQGFVCSECGNKTYCRLKSRPRVLQCNRCRYQTTLTGNTLFASTKLPLTKWFLALHLLTQSKTGISAMELKRQLGVNYETAWMMKHKLLQAMKEADDQHPISGIIQLDDVYWGGEHLGFLVGGKLEFLDHKAFNWVNTMIRNVKNLLRGSCHAFAAKQQQRYLAEYCFRINNRFNPRALLLKLARHAVRKPPFHVGF